MCARPVHDSCFAGRSGNESATGSEELAAGGGGDMGPSTSSHNHSVSNVDRKAYEKTCKLMDQVFIVDNIHLGFFVYV